jgi:hypothetical protein
MAANAADAVMAKAAAAIITAVFFIDYSPFFGLRRHIKKLQMQGAP